MDEKELELEQQETEEARLERLARAVFERLAAEWTERMEEDARVGAMTEEERGDYALKQREAALTAREQALRTRELRAFAAEELTARDLPAELADVMELRDEAGCTAAAEALENAFRTAVKRAVEARLAGETPTAGGAADVDGLSDEAYYRSLRA